MSSPCVSLHLWSGQHVAWAVIKESSDVWWMYCFSGLHYFSLLTLENEFFPSVSVLRNSILIHVNLLLHACVELSEKRQWKTTNMGKRREKSKQTQSHWRMAALWKLRHGKHMVDRLRKRTLLMNRMRVRCTSALQWLLFFWRVIFYEE